jgi:hypothetical protein
MLALAAALECHARSSRAADACQIGGVNDLAAIAAWLVVGGAGGPHTESD